MDGIRVILDRVRNDVGFLVCPQRRHNEFEF